MLPPRHRVASPRSFRLNSTFAIPQRTKLKAKPKHVHSSPKAVKPEELERQRKRRIEKAERDERMDMGFCLSPVKTYMGGFTRPRDLRITNWMPGGRYLQFNKHYASPQSSAYKPHTVFLLRSRYFIKHGLRRTNSPEYITGFCPIGQFQRYLRQINSGWASDELLEAMDNACWPDVSEELSLKPVKWWEKGEDPKALRERALKEEIIEKPTMKEQPIPIEQSLSSTGSSSSSTPLPSTESIISNSNSSTSSHPTSSRVSEEDAYESDDDDLSHDLALIEQARKDRRAKLRTLVREGVASQEVANISHTPFNPEVVLYELKYKKTPKTYTLEQIEYLADKVKLRHYAKHLSHIPDPSTQPFDDSLLDPNLLDPQFVDEKLAGTTYQLRKSYIPRLQEQPFWIPLLAITVPTRPLARVIARLGKALPRGLPYYASMPSEDLKTKASYPSRMNNLRLTRLRRLTIQSAERLKGYFGGFPGLRLQADSPGRGVHGMLLKSPLKEEQRRIIALVAESYRHAQEERAGYETEGRVPIITGLMNERGEPLDQEIAQLLKTVSAVEGEESVLSVTSAKGDRGAEESDEDSDDD